MQNISVEKQKALKFILVVPDYQKPLIVQKSMIPTFYSNSGEKIISMLNKHTKAPNPYPAGIDVVRTDVRMFGFARVYESGDGFYHDDEFLHKMNSFFWHRNYPTPFGGAGLFVGTNLEGETVAPVTDMETLQRDIRSVDFGMLNRLGQKRKAVKIEYEKLFGQTYKWQY